MAVLTPGPFSTSRVSVWIGGHDVTAYIRDFQIARQVADPSVDCDVRLTIPDYIAFDMATPMPDPPSPDELIPRLRKLLRVPGDHDDWELLKRVERLILAVAHGEPMATSSALEMLQAIEKDPQIWPNLQHRLKGVENQLKMEVALMTLRTALEQEPLTHE